MVQKNYPDQLSNQLPVDPPSHLQDTKGIVDLSNLAELILDKLDTLISQQPPESHLLSETDLAAQLKLKKQTLALWRSNGIGPKYLKVNGTAVRYRQKDVDNYIQSQTISR